MEGLGVLIHQLAGNMSSVQTFASAIGKTIKALSLGSDDALHFEFEDGSKMRIRDDGQSCCESRYMRTDDNLQDFIGATLLGAEIKEVPAAVSDDDYGDVHEIQFFEVQTNKGCFTMASHNEHNGYYGGFALCAEVE